MYSFWFFYTFGNWGLFALRAAMGAVFIKHGTPKLQHSAQLAPHMGMTGQMVWLVGLAEVAGGISLLTGLLTQLGAIAIIVVMAGAMYFKINKWNVPFVSTEKMGWEYDLVLLCAAIAILTIGAGSVSLDAVLFGM